MKESAIIQLTKPLIDNIKPKEIIYAEFAGGGAMGNSGGVIIYIIEDNTLLRYETSVFTNEDAYTQAAELLLKHQNQIKNNDMVEQENLFDHYYGGMGNNVFVNKSILLEIRDGYFLIKRDNVEYQVLPSVQGVFDSVVRAMKNSNNN